MESLGSREIPLLQQGTDGSRHPREAFPGILARIWPRIRSRSGSVGARMDFHVDPGNRPWNGAWNNGSRLESAWEHPRGGGIRPNSLNQLFSVFHFDFSCLSSRRRFRSRAEPSGGSSTIPDFFPVFFFFWEALPAGNTHLEPTSEPGHGAAPAPQGSSRWRQNFGIAPRRRRRRRGRLRSIPGGQRGGRIPENPLEKSG